jgi:hypothetical protein
VVDGPASGRDERLGRVVEEEAVEPADRPHGAAAVALSQQVAERRQARVLPAQQLLLGAVWHGGGAGLSVDVMLGEAAAPALAGREAGVLGEHAVTVVDPDTPRGLPDLDLATDQDRGHRVAIEVEVDVALDVDPARVHVVDFGDVDRQGAQRRLLRRPQLDRRGLQASPVLTVDAVAPRGHLRIEVVVIGEGPAGIEVPLDEAEGPFDPRRAVRVAQLVRDEAKAEAPAERLHAFGRDRVRPVAVGDDDRRVVDHAILRRATERLDCLAEEDAAFDPRPVPVAPGVDHPRVAQHQRGTLVPAPPVADADVVRRRVVLHLLAGPEVVRAGRHRRHLADAVAPTIRGQPRVRRLDAARLQLLVHAHEVALARVVQRPDRLQLRREPLRPLQLRHLRTAILQHPADRTARHIQRLRDRPRPEAPGVQLEGRDPRLVI